MMDDPIELFRAYIVKEARAHGRQAIDGAASDAPVDQIRKMAYGARLLEVVLDNLTKMQKDPQTWAVQLGLIRVPIAPVVAPEETQP